jgi:hypothetical protein
MAAGGLMLLGSQSTLICGETPGGSSSVDELELVGKRRPILHGHMHNLRQRASEAFLDMRSDAAKAGISLYSVSSYRSFEYQRGIWNRKFNKLARKRVSADKAVRQIIRYSAIPGTSRHHWGTDLDVTDTSRPQVGDILQAKHFREGGAFEALGNWLNGNADKYGFYEVYTDDPDRKGFEYEPWHLSFAESSRPFLVQYLMLQLGDYLADKTIEGSDCFSEEFLSHYRNDYVLGINPRLIPPEFE